MKAIVTVAPAPNLVVEMVGRTVEVLDTRGPVTQDLLVHPTLSPWGVGELLLLLLVLLVGVGMDLGRE